MHTVKNSLVSLMSPNHAYSLDSRKAHPGQKYHLEDLMVSVRAPERGEEDLGDKDLFLGLSKRAV